MPVVSVVIPTYGRVAVLERHLASVRAALLAFTAFEIIVVDDCSPDGTWEVVCSCAIRWPEVRGIRLAENAGQQNATLAGIHHAMGEVVVTMDDDLKNRPEDIPRLVEKLKSGYDVVYGVPAENTSGRYLHGRRHVPLGRRWGTILKEQLLGWLCHKPAGVWLTSFRAMNRATVDRIGIQTPRNAYVSAMIFHEPVRAGQMVTPEHVTPGTVSGYTPRKLFNLMLDLAIEYGRSPVVRMLRKPGVAYQLAEMTWVSSGQSEQ